MKITFMGAGSEVFTKNVLGDCMTIESLRDSEMALYDIDPDRLQISYDVLCAVNNKLGNHATIKKYCGVENRKDALRGANFVVNAIQVGLYDPCTIIDFEVPKRHGLRQTIGDTLGIGGIFRALRTIPVLQDFANDMEEVCPDALFLNYTNPMAMLTGYMLQHTGVKTVGLCHSTQVCSKGLLTAVGMEDKLEGRKELIAGINHMGWLLEIKDKDGNDLYPEIRRRAKEKLENPPEDFKDLVRFEYIRRFGYYCTESSEHNSEYNMFFIKSKYPELIERYRIPLDEYPRRCIEAQARWQKEYQELKDSLDHKPSNEFAAYIMQAIVENKPIKIGGNVLNTGHLIHNFPEQACVEVPCMIDGRGVNPIHIGEIPLQCAAMNMTNINAQLLTIEAAHTRKLDTIYQAAMMDPHTASELSIDAIIALCDDLIATHGDWLPKYH